MNNGNVYLSARKSMTVRLFIHSVVKRAEAVALLDSEATENFMNLSYARWLCLPTKHIPEPRRLFNVDNTENKSGKLRYYMDLDVWTGSVTCTMRFFLTDLGEHKVILGFPWFVGMQPKINWARGWIDHTQLPIIAHAPDAKKAIFTPWTRNVTGSWDQRHLMWRMKFIAGQYPAYQSFPTPRDRDHMTHVIRTMWFISRDPGKQGCKEGIA